MVKRSEHPTGDYGPPLQYDPTFEGPIHRRSCTDIICLVLFIVFVICWAFICGYAIMNGDVRKILAPTDSQGKKCGFSTDVLDKPYLLFFDLTKCLNPETPFNGCPTTQVCVKECPSEPLLRWSITSDADLTPDVRSKLICKSGVDKDKMTYKELEYNFNNEVCAPYIFKSKPILGRCLGNLLLIACTDSNGHSKQSGVGGRTANSSPAKNLLDVIKQSVSSLLESSGTAPTPEGGVCKKDVEGTKVINAKTRDQQMTSMIIEDLVNLKWWLLLALFIVMVICLLYITIMRWIAAPLVWVTILAVIAMLSYSVYLSYVNYVYYKENPIQVTVTTNISGWVDSVVAMKETWLVILIAAAVVLFVILIVIIFLRKRIVIAIALIKEGSRAVGSIYSTLFFPIFPWILEVAVVALAVTVALHLATIGEQTFRVYVPRGVQCSTAKNGDICNVTSFVPDCDGVFCKDTGVETGQLIKWMQAWNIVGFFWLEFFVQGVGDMVLAATFATWYWTFKKSNVPFFTLTGGLLRTLCYNLGTVAFGSLLITICRLIRLAIEYVDQKVKTYDNFLTKAIICCCRCFFACLESFLKFISKNAYIMCAIHGKGFLSSARDAFSLLMRNILRVFVLDKVTDFLFFLSKLLVACGCGAATYYAVQNSTFQQYTNITSLHYNLVPALLVGVVAYLIASVFFGVYSMAVDTLFLCFLEDLERNDGSPQKPYFMSKNLMNILGKKNKIN